MARIILEEQTTSSTPATNKVGFYPKPGGKYYQQGDDGIEYKLIDAEDALDFITIAEITTISGDIVSQIPDVSDFVTDAEITTISGDIVAQFPTDFYTQSEVTTISGDIVSQIPSLTGYATELYVTTISGDIVSQIPTDYITDSEMTTISGDIVAEISAGDSATLSSAEGYADTYKLAKASNLTDVASAPIALANIGGVAKTLFDAYSILAAVTDDTPVAVTIAAQQVIGRLTGGNIKGLSQTELTALLNAATTSLQGAVQLATNAEALNGSNTSKSITPDDLKYVLNRYQPRENLIGIPGAEGFGVGVCPLANLPTGMTPMAGYDDLGHDNYGNYIFTEGSVMIWVPKFYYRVGHASNPTYATYGVNSIDIKGIDTYATTPGANTDGYALHRAFIDGGVEKLGFFRDKYKCSKVANGAGYTAASIKNGLPLSSAAAHNPFSDLTGGVNYYYSALDLAHRRDGVDGAVNASSIFFCSSQFVRGAIAMLSMAHGQAATSTSNCAWYHATYNYPKGCNNNAFSDIDDTTVIWESDGYSNCGKTGSAGYGGGAGNVFAKSTHNGQNCGSADDNGLIYEISIGATCIATTKAIEAMSRANPCEITITAHGLATGDMMRIDTAITQADWVGLNSKVWPITKTGDNTFTVVFNSSAFGTAYDAGTDPGTCVLGIFYAAKQAIAMKTFTNGVAAATDHWGATGVAAMMDRFAAPFGDGDVFTQRFGSGANQVLSEVTSGAGYLLTGSGFPKDANGMDTTGTNLFGKDYCYVYVIDTMCLLVAHDWNHGSHAGVWLAYWSNIRVYSLNYVGFRAACYHV